MSIWVKTSRQCNRSNDSWNNADDNPMTFGVKSGSHWLSLKNGERTVLRAREILRTLEPTIANQEYAKKVVWNLIQGFSIPRHAEFIENPLHRVVKNSEREKLTNLAQASYPREGRLNRANLAGESTFYGAEMLQTALIETVAMPGDEYFHFQVMRDINQRFFVATIGELSSFCTLMAANPSAVHPAVKYNILQEHGSLRGAPPKFRFERSRYSAWIDGLLVEEFTRPDARSPESYFISSRIGSTLLSEGINGLRFPSVRHDGGFNLAIPARFLDSMFLPYRIAILRIDGIGAHGVRDFSIVCESERFLPNGDILWT